MESNSGKALESALTNLGLLERELGEVTYKLANRGDMPIKAIEREELEGRAAKLVSALDEAHDAVEKLRTKGN